MDGKIDMAVADDPRPDPWHPQYEVYGNFSAGTPDNKLKPLPKQSYRDYGVERQGTPEHYWSREIMKREWDTIWTKTWMLAGHINDIAKENRFMRFDLGKESFILVRGKGDDVHAFYNVCQHRGTRLELRDFGTALEFTCPFHGWRYNNKGELIHIFQKETFRKEVVCGDLNIPKARAEVWRGWVFLTVNPDAPPLHEFLGDEFMALGDPYKFEKLVRCSDVIQEWPVNWKLGQEAFIEGYHVEAVHPEIARLADTYHAQHDLYDNGHSLTIFPFMIPNPGYEMPNGMYDEYKTALQDAGVEDQEMPSRWTEARAFMAYAKRKNQEKLGIDYSGFSDGQLVDNFQMGFFPCMTFNSHAEGTLVQRWQPHPSDPEKMIYRFQVYALEGAKRLPIYFGVEPGTEIKRGMPIDVNYADSDNYGVIGPVLSQDRALLARLSAGNHSDAFRGGLYSEQEIRLRHFYDEYYKLMGK